MKTYFVDTETIGFHGVPVLLQWAIDDGPVHLQHVFTTPVRRVMETIRGIVDNRVVCHSLVFDWFHLSKIYNICLQVQNKDCTLSMFSKKELAEMEFQSQYGPCLKPRAAIDTLQLAQKGEAQSAVMNSKPIYIRRVARSMAPQVMRELEDTTDLPWILFARQANPDSPRWAICDRTDEETGDIEEGWVDIKMTFKPSNRLKDLAAFLLEWETTKFEEISLHKDHSPTEEGYAPFAALLSSEKDGWKYNEGRTWPALLDKHVEHWATDPDAQKYAEDDVNMVRDLYKFFGEPQEDSDGILACQVASVRLRGFSVDLEAMQVQKDISMEVVSASPINTNSAKQVRDFIAETLDPMEQLLVMSGCDKKVLASICQEFTLDEEEECCDDGCIRCAGRGVVGPGPMPVVERARQINDVRGHLKRVELYDKILLAKRAYPNFNVCGTKTGRMSGTSGLNFHGIVKATEVRGLFTFTDPGEVLSGGDYSGMEIATMATTSSDDKLLDDIKEGLSLHALLAAELFETTYEEIMENKDEDPLDRYGKAKSAIYLMAYGGTVETMAANIGLPLSVCKQGFDRFLEKYYKMKAAREKIKAQFTSLDSDAGGGYSLIQVENPIVESMYGYTRTFFNEYSIQKTVFDLMSNMPTAWKNLRMNVQRVQGRVQSISGSIYSALIGSAFSIQNGIIRAALNFEIQSACRTITLGLQSAIWDLQPQGIHEFRLTLMSIHDEVPVVSSPEVAQEVAEVVRLKLREQCQDIPLLALDWAVGLSSWGHLKSAKASNCDLLLECGFAEEVQV